LEITFFYITAGTKPEAETLGKQAVESRMAACANIMPMTSLYPWEGTLQREQEWILVLKTIPSRAATLQSFIEAHHTYSVPCILHWNVHVNETYGQWVHSMIEAESKI
jgi:periplasmic divalent cation tolerance protein